jgi:2,3-bisphosphoglycerate-independent phosphoglycerate mutase
MERALAAADGGIATLCGRYYAMDRDHRWERTEMAWRAMVDREGRQAASLREGIAAAYAADEDDEFIRPTVIAGGEAVLPGDPVIFFNFRKDRPRQTVTAFFAQEFPHFDRRGYIPGPVTCMMPYDASYGLPYAFEPENPAITVAEVVSAAGLDQFHCAETEKYAHVTFFYNGGRADPWPGEERRLIPSPRVATYDLQPAMSAPQVADAVVGALRSGRYPFVVVNFANGDMVGHTAVREAVIEAVEVLDREVGRVLDAARERGYSIILTADHGNCDEMVDPVTGDPHTQHTLYPVPCLVADEIPWRLSIGAGIGSVAPTVLQLLGLEVPKEMHARTLLLGPATPEA